MSAPRVAVIGGGLAGLAAACRLRQLGLDPTILERGAEVGGVVRTEEHEGWTIDVGAPLAAEPHPAVRELLDAAGVTGCTVRTDATGNVRYLVRGGVPVPLPRTTTEFAASPLFSLTGLLRLVKERWIPAQHDMLEESVDTFARRRFGDEMAERLFDPLVASTWAGDPKQLLARYAFPGLVGHEEHGGSGLDGSARARMEARRRAKGRPANSWSCVMGMQQLPRQLARFTGAVRTDAAVRSVAARRDGFEVVGAGAGGEDFDAVIFAVPAPVLNAIVIDVPEASRLGEVAAMPHASIATVALGFRRDQIAHPLDGARLLVPTVEQRSILSVVFPSSLFNGRAPRDHVLLTTCLGGMLRPELVGRPAAELIALVQQELAQLLGIRGAPVISRVTAWPDALPQAVAGHAARLAAADAVEATGSAIVFTGSWRDGLSVADVLLGGLRAAERLVSRQGWAALSPSTS